METHETNPDLKSKIEFLEIVDSVFLHNFNLTEIVLTRIIESALFDFNEHIRFVAQKTVKGLIDKKPDLADRVLTDIQLAMLNTDAIIRRAAQEVLWGLIEKRPDVIDASLIDVIAKTAVTDKDKNVRSAAQQTLEALAWSVAC